MATSATKGVRVETVALAAELIQRPSITPNDAGCQELIGQRLAKLGFTLETMVFEDTTNLWARRGTEGPVFCFAGHTDVVPVGNEDAWEFPPFAAVRHNGYLHGRGAADMKGSLAAMVVAVERFVAQYPDHQGSIAFLITSDEEGPFINGTTRVIDTLEARQEKITWCVVGEPSSTSQFGDVIKIGRRGSLSGDLAILGVQGHVAYPHLAANPVHLGMPALTELVNTEWDQGNASFPPTTFQISNIHAGTGATNVIPGELYVQFNARFSSELTSTQLIERIERVFTEHQLDYKIRWTLNGEPFLTDSGELLNAAIAAVQETTGIEPELSTSGGTSDGRFIAPTGAQVIELGPVNATIHKVNECVREADLDALTLAYVKILEKLLC